MSAEVDVRYIWNCAVCGERGGPYEDEDEAVTGAAEHNRDNHESN